MIKKDRIEDSPEFKYFEEHFDEIMEEMENDPELNNLEIPDEWDREFRKTIEETLKAERRKKMRRISKVVGAAACVVLVVTLGVGFKAEEVEGRGLLEVFKNTFSLNGKSYTTYGTGNEIEFDTDNEQEDMVFSEKDILQVYGKIHNEIKRPMLCMKYVPEGFYVKEARYNKSYRIINMTLSCDTNYIYIFQQQQIDDISSGIGNEEEKYGQVDNENLQQTVIIYKNFQDNSLIFSINIDSEIITVNASVSLDECMEMAKNIDYYERDDNNED